MNEANRMHPPSVETGGAVRDLRDLPWCSMDNDDSRDLDQLTVAGAIPGEGARVLIAIADVELAVHNHSAIDDHAKYNTTSVYTAAQIFPMLPEKLSTDITSLNPGADRLAFIVELILAGDGSLQQFEIYRGAVRNHAKLAYDSVGAWLEENGPTPEAIEGIKGLAENLRLQHRTARKLKTLRHNHGALDLETIEARPVFEGDEVTDLRTEKRNAAKDIIEDFMIMANGVSARFLATRNLPSVRRVVRVPKRWDRIEVIAREMGHALPHEPDARALDVFLLAARAADPIRFPDLSLSIIKLLGPGEYAVELPGGISAGHFGLAVKDYSHSTAPNRRYPDLITQRLLKAAMARSPSPYAPDELEALARHCTENEDAAKKVERRVAKSAAAILMESRIHERFDAVVTGASIKGTWVRIFHPPVEGKLVHGTEGLDVGHRVRVELIATNVEQGYIDFKRTE
jgi:exoribonuclease-2